MIDTSFAFSIQENRGNGTEAALSTGRENSFPGGEFKFQSQAGGQIYIFFTVVLHLPMVRGRCF